MSLPACSWDHPGADVYRGDVAAAVDHYTDIPPATRAALKRRMAAYQYDEIATIHRDSIEGRHRYGDLRDMHFGQGQVCRSVTRDNWPAGRVERGLVYCEGETCLIVPTVCRNVSRVTRVPAPQAAGAAPAAPAAAGAPGPAAAAPTDELVFEAPGAGSSPDARPATVPTSFASASQGGQPSGAAGAPGSFTTIGPPPPTYGTGWGGGGGGWVGSGVVPLVVPSAPVPAVPEAPTLASMAAGLMLLLAARHKRRRAEPTR